MRTLVPLTAALLTCAGCAAPPVRVLSFNIRFANPADGPNRWENRRDEVVRTIQDFAPDILGLQEVLASQADELRAALPDYGFVGVGRADGDRAGEMVPVLFRSAHYELVDHGHMWLSERPDVPGVKGWDAACERMVTWVRLRSRRAPRTELYVLNTHFDHVGAQARRRSAAMVLELAEKFRELPVLVTGDFNCAPGSPPYRVLTAPADGGGALRDTYALAGGTDTDAGTYNGFRGTRTGARIDWILVNERFDVLEAGIDRRSFERGGQTRYPSDHFAVTAIVRVREP